MKDSYKEKVYEFSKVLGNSNEWVGNVRIIQIGETGLDKTACIEEHIQTCNEITYIISGSGTLISDKTEIQCRAGDIHIVSKGMLHKIIASSHSPLRYIHFAFDFDGYEPRILAEFYGQCKSVLVQDDGDVKNILNMLVDEYYNNPEYTAIVRHNLIQLVLVLIWRKIHAQTQRFKPDFNEELIGSTIYNVIKYIDEHISDKITVASIADNLSYSVSYISHLFKLKTGVALKEYMIAMRMDYARTLLEEGKLSLAEVARLTGYESIQSFCKRFKMHTGVTPGDVKNNKFGGEQ